VHKSIAIVMMAVVAGIVTGGADSDAGKKIVEKLQGNWQLVKAETSGKPAPEEKVAGTVMTFDKDSIVIRVEGKNTNEEATYKIDASKKPVAIDLHPPKQEKVVQGILLLEGDTLKICFARRGGARPSDFKSPADQQVTLLELKRVKK
jgi:uncharacterized protein (TIGR03067 family)